MAARNHGRKNNQQTEAGTKPEGWQQSKWYNSDAITK